jgi:hypothetical protein
MGTLFTIPFIHVLTPCRIITQLNLDKKDLRSTIDTHLNTISKMSKRAETYEFELDEIKFNEAKFRRRNEVLEKDMKYSFTHTINN